MRGLEHIPVVRWPAILAVLAGALLAGAAQAGSFSGPDTSKKVVPVRITRVYARAEVRAGAEENYRVRIEGGATWPIVYRWDLGDGTVAEGNNVVHRYARPGAYTIRVTASNEGGTSDARFAVRVLPPDTARDPVTPMSSGGNTSKTAARKPAARRVDVHPLLYSPMGFDRKRGGYAWVVATSLEAFEAERLAQSFRNEGYRTGIYADTSGRGSTAYRVLAGQFDSEAEALAARPLLARHVPRGLMLTVVPPAPAVEAGEPRRGLAGWLQRLGLTE